MLYACCLALIISGLPLPNSLAAAISAAVGLWCVRQRPKANERPEPKVTPFLLLVGVVAVCNLIAANGMSKSTAEFMFSRAVGPPAWTVRPPLGGIAERDNGLVWFPIFLLFMLPLFALAAIGLTYLAGTFLEYVFGRSNKDGGERR